tara:strand:+ start:1772 stop:2077 length:306 start_codon:yes stop_codon:yes gene_type:complete
MKKLDKVFYNCEWSLKELEQADKDHQTLQCMNEEDREDWEEGEFDSLMLLIDKSATTLEQAKYRHNLNKYIRNITIKDLSDKKKFILIMNLLDKELDDLPF